MLLGQGFRLEDVVVGTLADLFGWAVSFGVLAAFLGVALGLLAPNRARGLGY